jgi:N-acetylneuraminic acid mutarotase
MKQGIAAALVAALAACGDGGTGPATEMPATPVSVAINALANGAIEVTWTDAAGNETNYQVQRRDSGGSTFVPVATLSANTTRFVDNDVSATAQFCYRVRATAGAQSSAFSDVVCATAKVPPLGAWLTRTTMPTARQEMAAAEYNGEVFVVGGLDKDGIPHATLEIYKPATATWRTGAMLPSPRHHLGVVRIGARIYAVGGFVGAFPGWSGTSDLWEYDPAANQWQRRASMPEPRGGHAAVAVNGRIYVVGGVRDHADPEHSAKTVLIYDPATDSWTTGAPMLVGREHLAAAAIGNRVYVVGGRETTNQSQFGSTTTNFSTLEAYDVTTNTWQQLSPMPTARGGLFAEAWQGRLYVFGGEFPAIFAQVEEYDPATNSWRQLAPMAQPRHAAAVAVVGDTIFTLGGGPVFGFSESRTNHAFLPPPR